MHLEKYGQYKHDLFTKLNFPFLPKKKIIDIGCGGGSDAEIFINEYRLDTYGMDVYKHKNIKKIKGLKFKKSGIEKIPFPKETFDYAFAHDVLHHIDDGKLNSSKYTGALLKLARVVKKGGRIIIVEGNRYNPLFYPHMVLMKKHNHFRQSYFENLMKQVFKDVEFRYFEAHVYPPRFIRFWRLYDWLMDNFCPKQFLAYNIAIVSV
mgnify:FL=1